MKKAIILVGLITAGTLMVSIAFAFIKPFYDYNPDTDQEILDFNYVIGTQTVGPKYQFTDETTLVETAREIRAMGSNLLKFSMHPRYCTENYGLPKNEEIKSLKDLAIYEPSMKRVLNMDFKYYHIWVYGFSQYTPEPEGEKIDTSQTKFIGGYSRHYEEALYKELYDFTAYMLREYSGTGKVFYLGHWEGDWHLRWHYDRNRPVDPATLQGMIAWEKVRQKAIDDAKKDTPHEGVAIYNYIEVNLVRKAIEEGVTTVANSVIPEVNPDYVSYSSYDATNPYKTKEELNTGLKESLTYIESFLSPKEGLPEGRRVWIGEYGNPANRFNEDDQDERSRWTINAGLEWGAPFILYWELYNNEINPDTQEQVGYWLIDDLGQKQKIWYTHHQFYQEARAYLKNYYSTNHQMPSQENFFREATRFKSLQDQQTE